VSTTIAGKDIRETCDECARDVTNALTYGVQFSTVRRRGDTAE
jgi:hypothetical protein